MKRPIMLSLSLLVLTPLSARHAAAAVPPVGPPNILFLLADDMGYGDPRCFNGQSKCATPNIDALAAQGMRFTDAHAAGSVCVPSRYGLLTGRYPFRCAHLDPTKGPLIEPGRVTLASLLRDRGYATEMIGKWHLGFDGGDHFDFSQPLRGGPFDHGFDHFFGQHASLDIPPYFYIENDRCVAAPLGQIAAHRSPDWSPIQGAFWRAGGIAADFKHDDVLPVYTCRAADYLGTRGKAVDGKPFFLYLAFTAPHTPWLPTEKFRGASAGNLYADWVTQVDDSIGQVLAALDHAGLTENTLVFFSSDNGPVWYPEDVKKYGHAAAGTLRGMKGDAWEGGHREPFIAKWPGKIAAGSTSRELICFTDLLATFAALTGAALPAGAGEDSFSFLPELRGQKHTPARTEMLLGWGKGNLFMRKGDWKLIPFLGSGGFSKPSKVKPKPGEPSGQLYNLAHDPGETNNVYAAHPEIVKELTADAERVRDQGRSRPL